jgi:hypothetical protein
LSRYERQYRFLLAGHDCSRLNGSYEFNSIDQHQRNWLQRNAMTQPMLSTIPPAPPPERRPRKGINNNDNKQNQEANSTIIRLFHLSGLWNALLC